MSTQSPISLPEVELYTFTTAASTTFHLTPHEFDVVLGSQRFVSTPLERSELSLGAEAAKSALELKLPPDGDLVRHLRARSATGQTTAATLRIAGWDESSQQWSLVATRWMGRVLGVEMAHELARIRCESAQVSLKRIGLRRLYSRRCSHVLYSSACGASPLTAGAVVASTASARVVLMGQVPSNLQGALAGGWLQTPDGAQHMILSQEPASVELLYPVALEAGTPVLLTAGCDHSAQVCAARFDNLDNYGGFPAIPSKNPFATGVF